MYTLMSLIGQSGQTALRQSGMKHIVSRGSRLLQLLISLQLWFLNRNLTKNRFQLFFIFIIIITINFDIDITIIINDKIIEFQYIITCMLRIQFKSMEGIYKLVCRFGHVMKVSQVVGVKLAPVQAQQETNSKIYRVQTQ